MTSFSLSTRPIHWRPSEALVIAVDEAAKTVRLNLETITLPTTGQVMYDTLKSQTRWSPYYEPEIDGTLTTWPEVLGSVWNYLYVAEQRHMVNETEVGYPPSFSLTAEQMGLMLMMGFSSLGVYEETPDALWDLLEQANQEEDEDEESEDVSS